MTEDFIVAAYPVISILIGVGTLGGFIYKMGAWINKKAETKAAILKEVTEKKADELRKYAEEVAKEVRDINEKQIADLQKRLDGLEDKIDKVFQRADLVNGNVSNIRTDIADLQEDLLELYSADDIEYEQNEDSGRHIEVDKGRGRDSVSSRKNRKRVDLNRRLKRRKIESDRIEQSEREKR